MTFTCHNDKRVSSCQKSNSEDSGMKEKEERLTIINDFIRNKIICSFDEISKKVGCSERSLRRDIKTINAHTSYTHGGQFITLPDIPVFDANGIWRYNNVGFTRFKNSLNLVEKIINHNRESITKEELEEILKIKISKQIQILLKRNRLNRIKLGHTYHYLSNELSKNKKKRIQLLNVSNIEEYYDKEIKLTDLIAVLKAVLLDCKIAMNDLKRFTEKYSLTAPIKKIEQLLLKYNLSEKKKP